MDKNAISSATSAPPVGPYSHAVAVGNMIYLSGQIPIGSDGSVIGTEIGEQTEQVISNIRSVLSSVGCDLNDIVKVTIFLKDMSDFKNVNEIYGRHFSEPYPARSCVAVSELPKKVLIEIEAVAVISN